MSRVLALDLSLTASGFAVGESGKIIQSGVIPGKYDDIRRLIHNRNAVCDKVDAVKPDLVVFEDLAQSRNMAYAKEIAGMAHMVRAELFTDHVPYILVQASSLKKFVVGTAGSAKTKVTKDLIMLNLFKRFGVETSDNNQADACGLCFIGMALLGEWEPQMQPQRDVLATVRKSSSAVLSILDKSTPICSATI